MTIYRTLILYILLGTNALFSQFNKNIEISSYFDDNLYRSPYAVSDIFTNIDVRLSFNPENSPLNLSYDGSFFLYQEAKDRNFSFHGIGLSYFDYFGAEEDHSFYFCLNPLLYFFLLHFFQLTIQISACLPP